MSADRGALTPDPRDEMCVRDASPYMLGYQAGCRPQAGAKGHEPSFVTVRAREFVPVLLRPEAPPPLHASFYVTGNSVTPPLPPPALVPALSSGFVFERFASGKHAYVAATPGARLVLAVEVQSRWALVGMLHSPQRGRRPRHSAGIAHAAALAPRTTVPRAS